ncbi:hypothetical protein ABTE27_23475, partial [Acinetobacter baumannii]
KGRLSYATFCATVGGAVVFNLVVFALMRSQLIPARSTANPARIAALYAIWLGLASLGFLVIANAFIKRWTSILGLSELGKT